MEKVLFGKKSRPGVSGGLNVVTLILKKIYNKMHTEDQVFLN